MPQRSLGQKTTSNLLVIVYGLKTHDYRYFDLFYPAQRLTQEATNRGLSLRFLFPADLPKFIESAGSKITPKNTVFLFRGAVSLSDIELVERCGFIAINPARSVRIANDKKETARFLSKQGIAQPRLFTSNEISSELWPVVAKPRFGSRGNGVCLVRCFEDIPNNDNQYGEYLLQEYIAPSHGRDFRVFFAFGRILAAVERRAGSDKTGTVPIVSNTSNGGTLLPSPFSPMVPESIEAQSITIAEETGLRYGTIDFLYGTAHPNPEHLIVCELNAFPGFTALEKEGGFNIAGPIIQEIARLFLAK